MYSNFIVSISAVIPIFVLIGMGMLVRRAKLMTDTELTHMNRMVFKVFFFCMLFSNIYRADFSQVFNPKLMLFGAAAVTLLFLGSIAFVCWFEPSNQKRGAMVQAIFRSNFVVLGIPIVVNIFGDEAAVIPMVMIAVIIPLYNVYAVVELETFRGGHANPKTIIKNIMKNPMIDGLLTGALFKLLGIELPKPILQPIMQVAAATTPVALIILGATFQFSKLAATRRDLIACVTGRLVVAPALFLGAAALLGFRGPEFVTILAISATPCAVASFPMAQAMGSDGVLAGNTVIVTSALCGLTMFAWIFITKSLGMF